MHCSLIRRTLSSIGCLSTLQNCNRRILQPQPTWFTNKCFSLNRNSYFEPYNCSQINTSNRNTWYYIRADYMCFTGIYYVINLYKQKSMIRFDSTVVEISIKHPIKLLIIFLLLHKFLWKFVCGISIHILFYNNFSPKKVKKIRFWGWKKYKTVLKICI